MGQRFSASESRRLLAQSAASQLVRNPEDFKSGICHLKWRILEPGDGTVLQIIYAGNASGDPTLEGVVEGQKGGVVVERYDINPDRKSISPTISITRLVELLVLLLVVCLLLFFANKIHANTAPAKKLAEEKADIQKLLAELQKKNAPMPLVSWIFIGAAIIFLLGILWLILFGWSAGPPFGW
jgi:hypothetical protein